MALNAWRAAPEQTGDDPQLSSSAADFHANIPNKAPAQVTNPRAVREAKLELLREAIFEASGFVRLHAETCQLNAEAGDDAGLIHSLRRLVIYTKHAAKAGNDLRAIRDESASNKEGGR